MFSRMFISSLSIPWAKRLVVVSTPLFWISCHLLEGPVAPRPVDPVPFQNVKWDAIPSDFLLSTIEYQLSDYEPYEKIGFVSRVYRFRKAERTVSTFLESNSLVYRDIALSPDGRTLAFCSAPMEKRGYETGTRKVHFMDLQSMTVTAMGGDSTMNHAKLSWSVGGRLAYTTQHWLSRDSLTTIWIDGTSYYDHGHPMTQPLWSGDGNVLYFVAKPSIFSFAIQHIDTRDWSVATTLSDTSFILPAGQYVFWGGLPLQRGLYVHTKDLNPHWYYLSYDGTTLEKTRMIISPSDSFIFPTDRRIVLNLLGNALQVSNTESEEQQYLFSITPGDIVGFCPVWD